MPSSPSWVAFPCGVSPWYSFCSLSRANRLLPVVPPCFLLLLGAAAPILVCPSISYLRVSVSLSLVYAPWSYLLRWWFATTLVASSAFFLSGIPCVLPPLSPLLCRLFLAKALRFFLFTSLLTRSNLSSFATGSSLWAESVRSAVSFASFSSVLTVFVRMYMVLLLFWSFLFLFLSRRCHMGCPLLRHLFVVPLPLSLFSCGLAPSGRRAVFPSFPSLFYSVFLPGIFCSLLFLRVQLCCLINVLLWLYLLSFSWRQASGKFPSPPAILQLQFSSAAIGRCSWRLHLSPLVHCVHGDSTNSSQPCRMLRLAPPSIPSGPLCPWNSIACPLPYRLLW